MNIKSAMLTAGLMTAVATTSAFAIVIVDGEKDGIFSGPENYDGPLTLQRANVIDFLDGPVLQVTADSDNSNVGGKGGYDGGTTVTDPFPIMGEVGPGGVMTGIEYALELSELDFAAGPSEFIKLTVMVNNEFHDDMSNQILGLGFETDGLGEPRDIDFNALPGDQFVDVPTNGGPMMAATVDGVLDAHYPAALWTQSIGTSAGDNTDATVDFANGSELNAVYAYVDESTDILYVFVSGNISSDFRKLEMFLDVKSGGQNTLRGDNSDVGFGGLNRMGDDGVNMNGMTFDPGFAADYWISYTVGAAEPQHYLDAAAIGSLGGAPGGFVGGGVKASTNPITGTGPAGNGTLSVTSDNSNLGGIAGRSPQGGSGSEADVTDPATVTTGVEMVIDLEGLNYDISSIGGGSAADVAFTVMLMGSNLDFLSNQVLGGLTSMADMDPGNPGFPAKDVDLNDFDGNQFATLTMPGSLSNPGIVIDGTLDGAYGSAVWVNTTNGSGFGDSVLGDPDESEGSEMCAVYATLGLRAGNPAIYLFVAGNLFDWNRLACFFDTVPGEGQNDLRGDNADIDNLNNGLGGPDGFTFDTGFAPDAVVIYGTGDNDGTIEHFVEGGDLFTNGGGNGGRVDEQVDKTQPVSGAYEPRVGFGDNDDATANFGNGNELDAMYARVEGSNACFFIAGNLATDFTALQVFFDTVPSQGQNTLLYDDPSTPENEGNVKIDSGALDRMGGPVTFVDDTDPENPMIVVLNDGLTFDTGFEPDYWVGVKTGNFDGFQAGVFLNLVELRNGMDAGEGWFVGQGITGGLGALTGGDAGAPLAQLDINNSNTAGVVGSMNPYDGGNFNPALVDTGIEFCVPLASIGWDGMSEIGIAAFITGEFHDTLSNQSLQHICEAAPGEIRDVDFNDYQGLQYFTYDPMTGMNSNAEPDMCVEPVEACPGDTNGDLFVNFDDLNAVLGNWNTAVPAGTMGDVAPFPGGDGFVNFDDLNAVLGNWNTSCAP